MSGEGVAAGIVGGLTEVSRPGGLTGVAGPGACGVVGPGGGIKVEKSNGSSKF